jgi:hypothetical protein
LIKNGLEISIDQKKSILKVRIMLLIADAPAIAKVLNMNQYNGWFGCVKCLHPTDSLYKFKKSNQNESKGRHNRRIYSYTNKFALRTNSDYKRALRIAKSQKKIFQGVKGPCWISKFLSIPEDVFLDPMHTCFLGPAEDLLSMWCKSATKEKKQPGFSDNKKRSKKISLKNEFYLNPNMKKILDDSVVKIKYPNEIKRHQRTISDNLGDMKANEFRNTLFYQAPIIRKVQKSNIFKHFAAYVTAMRLMCQSRISKTDLHDAYILIDYFVKRYSTLYGRRKMNWKIHAHLHLPYQALYFGSLNLITTFAFECNLID